MSKSKGGPHAETAIVKFLAKRIDNELAGRKTQREIAQELGFRPNVISMFKLGETKVPLDRVPALAKALEVDPAKLFRLALDQHFNPQIGAAIMKIFGDVITQNEADWIRYIREVTGDKDPDLTDDMKNRLKDALAPLAVANLESA